MEVDEAMMRRVQERAAFRRVPWRQYAEFFVWRQAHPNWSVPGGPCCAVR